jgi:hypothetical protein
MLYTTTKDNERPSAIAKRFDISLADLLMWNKTRLDGLRGNSRLKMGTSVVVETDWQDEGGEGGEDEGGEGGEDEGGEEAISAHRVQVSAAAATKKFRIQQQDDPRVRLSMAIQAEEEEEEEEEEERIEREEEEKVEEEEERHAKRRRIATATSDQHDLTAGLSVLAMWDGAWLKAKIVRVEDRSKGSAVEYAVSEPGKKGVTWNVARDEVQSINSAVY